MIKFSKINTLAISGLLYQGLEMVKKSNFAPGELSAADFTACIPDSDQGIIMSLLCIGILICRTFFNKAPVVTKVEPK